MQIWPTSRLSQPAEDVLDPGLEAAANLRDLEPLPEDCGDLKAVSSPKAVLKIRFGNY